MKYSLALLISLIFFLGGVTLAQDTDLKIISKPKPGYTDKARQNYIVGDVTLSVQFLENGDVGEIKVVSGLPDGLVEKAIAAARKIKFEPKRVHGAAVSETKTVEYSFDIALSETDPDIKQNVKITKGPIFHFDAAEEKVLKSHLYKIEVLFARTGNASVVSITPTITAVLAKKIKAAFQDIVFEPAVVSGGKKVSVIKSFDLH